MSLKAMIWALKEAPVENPQEQVLLIALADQARDNGITWLGWKTLADLGRCSRRTVARHLEKLEQRGLIARASHPAVQRIRADRRPVVWRLNLEVVRERPIFDEDDEERGDNLTPREAEDDTPTGCQPGPNDAPRGDNSGSTRCQPGLHEVSSRASRGVTAMAPDTKDYPRDDPKEDPHKNRPASPHDDDPSSRPDVEQLCRHLRNRIIDNGSRPPTITKAWRTEARLLLDRDKVPLHEALAGIDWCQDHEFWKSNILSMPTFRKQFDKLRLQAQRDRTENRSPGLDKVQGWLDLGQQMTEPDFRLRGIAR